MVVTYPFRSSAACSFSLRCDSTSRFRADTVPDSVAICGARVVVNGAGGGEYESTLVVLCGRQNAQPLEPSYLLFTRAHHPGERRGATPRRAVPARQFLPKRGANRDERRARKIRRRMRRGAGCQESTKYREGDDRLGGAWGVEGRRKTNLLPGQVIPKKKEALVALREKPASLVETRMTKREALASHAGPIKNRPRKNAFALNLTTAFITRGKNNSFAHLAASP